uniref:cDNA FLJ25553 fis, clone JTH02483 n=1 Tax=Homo sapiens TaxID=9606 RepID=Q8N7H7_HUMAN|nr:unnamed protein product [Homo sapiens]
MSVVRILVWNRNFCYSTEKAQCLFQVDPIPFPDSRKVPPALADVGPFSISLRFHPSLHVARLGLVGAYSLLVPHSLPVSGLGPQSKERKWKSGGREDVSVRCGWQKQPSGQPRERHCHQRLAVPLIPCIIAL